MARRRTRLSLATIGALALTAMIQPHADAAPRDDEAGPAAPERSKGRTDRPVPRDPNDLPPMPPPGGQPRPDDLRWDPAFANHFGERRRVQLTLMPIYASVRLDFIGRPQPAARNPMRGGGGGLELDIELLRPFWLRLVASHTVHPVDDRFATNDDDEIVQTAARGNVQATDAGLSAVYAMDFGRILPLLDVGLGVLWLRSPAAVVDGQLGGECLQSGACDPGLVCASDNTCQMTPVLELHAGVAVDVLITDRWTVGAGLRYFALLSNPAVYPVYLQGTVRGGIRF
jgi:hypothetical protein